MLDIAGVVPAGAALLAGPPMTSHEDIAGFVSTTFRSVWSLELLLLLKSRTGAHAVDELVAMLRASELVVRQSLGDLVAGRLVTIDERGCAAFAPASERLAALVDGAEELYARRPDAVRRLIVSAKAPGLTAFADAFRLRKD